MRLPPDATSGAPSVDRRYCGPGTRRGRGRCFDIAGAEARCWAPAYPATWTFPVRGPVRTSTSPSTPGRFRWPAVHLGGVSQYGWAERARPPCGSVDDIRNHRRPHQARSGPSATLAGRRRRWRMSPSRTCRLVAVLPCHRGPPLGCCASCPSGHAFTLPHRHDERVLFVVVSSSRRASGTCLSEPRMSSLSRDDILAPLRETRA